jgi:hypothetical protein
VGSSREELRSVGSRRGLKEGKDGGWDAPKNEETREAGSEAGGTEDGGATIARIQGTESCELPKRYTIGIYKIRDSIARLRLKGQYHERLRIRERLHGSEAGD